MPGHALSRDALVGAIMSVLQGQDLLSLAEVRAELEAAETKYSRRLGTKYSRRSGTD